MLLRWSARRDRSRRSSSRTKGVVDAATAAAVDPPLPAANGKRLVFFWNGPRVYNHEDLVDGGVGRGDVSVKRNSPGICVTQGQAAQATNRQRRLNNKPIVPTLTSVPSAKPISNGPTSSSTDTSKKTAAAIAAEVADRVAASTHSQQIMGSFSSLLHGSSY